MKNWSSNSILRRVLFVLFATALLPAQDNETCAECHDDETFTTTIRGVETSLYVTEDQLVDTPHEGFACIDCHTALADVEDFPHAPRLQPPDCGACHPEVQQEFISDFLQPLRDQGYTSLPTCSDCHGTHQITVTGDPRKTCGVCHQGILKSFFQSVHWSGKVETSEVTCVSCHAPHNKQARAQVTSKRWRVHFTDVCRTCHGEDVATYDGSVHYQEVLNGNPQAPVCSDCHTKHQILAPRNPESSVSVAKMDLVCTKCHSGYENSLHRPQVNGDPRLETCAACHTGHETNMTGKVKGSIFDVQLDAVCLRCHKDNLIVGKKDAHGAIHREQLAKIEAGEPANCGACHSYHFMAPKHSQDRSLRKKCGDCHQAEKQDYESSIHFLAWSRGHKEAPTCIDCHDERRIKTIDERFTGQSIIALCSRCHDNRELTMKFQLNPNVVAGYESSYHGQMYQLGYQGEEFATCVSCHDNHSILPSDNPVSTISQAHIIETCGKCHDNVNSNFVKYLQHYSPQALEENPILNSINTFMVWLLGSVLVIFGGHTLLWLMRLIIRRIKEGPIKKPSKTKYRVRRFSRFERIQHLGLILSFLTLASTGLPLKYSHSEIANWIANNLVGFRTAAFLHRLAAFVLITIFVIHIGKILYLKFILGRKGIFWGPNSLTPRGQDIKDFFAHLTYFIGLRKEPPRFGRWTYWEKFDYLAVFWGMVVIGASGLTLWFPESFTQLVPGWLINAAHIIHSEEALLATAFIFTIHFFNTHLRPGAFPMDEVIFTGRLTEEQFREERTLELESLSEAEYRAKLVPPLPKWKKYLAFIAGYTFLSIGFLLLVVIIIGTFF